MGMVFVNASRRAKAYIRATSASVRARKVTDKIYAKLAKAQKGSKRALSLRKRARVASAYLKN